MIDAADCVGEPGQPYVSAGTSGSVGCVSAHLLTSSSLSLRCRPRPTATVLFVAPHGRRAGGVLPVVGPESDLKELALLSRSGWRRPGMRLVVVAVFEERETPWRYCVGGRIQSVGCSAKWNTTSQRAGWETGFPTLEIPPDYCVVVVRGVYRRNVRGSKLVRGSTWAARADV